MKEMQLTKRGILSKSKRKWLQNALNLSNAPSSVSTVPLLVPRINPDGQGCMPDVSIIIVNWNTRELLLQCIATAIAAAKRCCVEIIVVDNASTDGSAEAVEACNTVKLIRATHNLGFAAANNLGIKAANGRYICLVNSDVEILDDCLDRMCEYMDRHPEIGLLGPLVLNRDRSVQRSCSEFPSVWNTFTQALMLDRIFPGCRWFRTRFIGEAEHQLVKDVDVLSGCFLMARQEALQDVGALDERFFFYKEDVDWCRRFHDQGWRVVFYPDARAVHYGGASSSAAPIAFVIQMEKANLQYWRKHHSWIARRAVMVINAVNLGIRAIGWSVLALSAKKKELAVAKSRTYAACLTWLMKAGHTV